MKWYVVQGGEDSGPFTPDQMRQLAREGRLKPGHTVRPEADQRLFKARELSDLFPQPEPPRDAAGRIANGTKRPVDINTGFQPAPYGSLRPSDGYLAGVGRILTWRPVLVSVATLAVSFAIYYLRGTTSPVVVNGNPTVLSPSTASPDGLPAQVADLKDQIERWKVSRAKLADLAAALQQDRQGVLGQLDGLGVKNVGEGASDPRAKVLLDELRDILQQQGLTQKKHEEFDLAIFKSESRLRTIGRRNSAQQAGISEAELEELTRSMIALDESLASETETELPVVLDDVLSTALGSYRKEQQDDQDQATIFVDLAPKEARLVAAGTGVVVKGDGRYRQVHVVNPDGRESYTVFVSLDGYEPFSKGLVLQKGQKEFLTVSLSPRTAGEPRGVASNDVAPRRSDSSPQILRGHTSYVSHVAISPDGRYVASAANDHSVRLWERVTGREVWKVASLSSAVFALEFSPEGNRLWVATKDATKRLDTSSGAESKGMKFQPCGQPNLGGVAFGNGCSRFAVSGDGWVRIYDGYRQKEMAVFDNSWVPCLAFSKTGGEVFFGGGENDGRVRLLQINGKKLVRSFSGLRDRTVCLRVSPDGRYLAASSGPAVPKQRPSQNMIAVWEVASGRLVQRFTVSEGWQYGLSFSPDSRLLASGGYGTDEDWYGHRNGADNVIRIWDLQSGKEHRRLIGHSAAVLSTEFTPDGQYLVSGGADSTVRLWSLSTGLPQ